MTDRPPAGDPTESGTFAARLTRLRWPLRAAYVGVLLLATLSWLRVDVDPDHVARRLNRALQPNLSARDVVDGARNVALFAGWGLVWMVTAGRGSSLVALRNAVLSGAALSVLVEGLQLLSWSRNASVLDLATNTAGAFLGAISLILLVQMTARRLGGRSFVGVPTFLFAVPYAVAVLGEAFIPLFRQELARNVTGGPVQRFTIAWDFFDWGSVFDLPLGELFLFGPAGMLAVAALSELGVPNRKAAAWVSVIALPLFALAEVAHGALGIPIEAGPVVVHVAGVAGGAYLAAWGLPGFSRSVRGADRPRAVVSCYAMVLGLWALRPFLPEISLGGVMAKFASDWWIPLRMLGMRMDLFSVVDVLSPFLLYLPLGAILAVWPLRRGGWLSGFLPALYLAMGTEVAQTLVLTRTLDITDFLVQAAGASVGWVVVRRAGFKPYGALLKPTGRTSG